MICRLTGGRRFVLTDGQGHVVSEMREISSGTNEEHSRAALMFTNSASTHMAVLKCESLKWGTFYSITATTSSNVLNFFTLVATARSNFLHVGFHFCHHSDVPLTCLIWELRVALQTESSLPAHGSKWRQRAYTTQPSSFTSERMPYFQFSHKKPWQRMEK